jgi:hypothetical protein
MLSNALDCPHIQILFLKNYNHQDCHHILTRERKVLNFYYVLLT